MYKILDDIMYCGKVYKPGDTCDFKELREIQIKQLIDKGLIEPIKITESRKIESESPKASKIETRLKGSK